jgi:hypothetical protein
VPQFSTWPSPSFATAFSLLNFPYGRALSTNFAGFDNTVNLGTAGAVTPMRYYYNTTMNIGTGGIYDLATLNINGPVILYINGNLYLRAGGILKINESGSAEIHVDGAIRVESTATGFVNTTQDPKRLILISDITTTTTQYLAAAGNFYGLIYAPNTTATLGLEIRTGVIVHGAVSAREVTFSTEANLHYDSTLRHATIAGVDQPYAIYQWRELTSASELATMP